MKELFPLSASRFITWATHRSIISQVRGIIEHHCHHNAVEKYQLTTAINHSYSEEPNWFERENMPSTIRQSQLIMSERSVSSIHVNLKLYGRLDQLYQFNGVYFLVDTKSHEAPTFTDQLQLSFYSLILTKNGYRMANEAYIRSVYTGEPHYQIIEIIPLPTMLEIINEVE